MGINSITHDQFETQVLQAKVPVLVDFWAPWCGPCRMLTPELDKLATRFAGRLKVLKVNIDENTQLARSFNVTGVPTLLFFDQGQLVGQHVGFIDAQSLGRGLESLVSAA